jgi:transposase
MPLVEVIRAHVLAAERIHADDTTVPLLAKGRCRTGRLWAYVRDDRPFAGTAAPAAAFFYSADRGAIHPDAHLATYAGLMQADAYAGFNRLYEASRKPGPIVEAMCWAHARRKFFDLARLSKAPIAIEAVERIDALFAIERDINGKPPPERARVRNEHSRPIVTELETWLRKQRAKLFDCAHPPRRRSDLCGPAAGPERSRLRTCPRPARRRNAAAIAAPIDPVPHGRSETSEPDPRCASLKPGQKTRR